MLKAINIKPLISLSREIFSLARNLFGAHVLFGDHVQFGTNDVPSSVPMKVINGKSKINIENIKSKTSINNIKPKGKI